MMLKIQNFTKKKYLRFINKFQNKRLTTKFQEMMSKVNLSVLL